jgi:multidrug efflux system membrane fusion protein
VAARTQGSETVIAKGLEGGERVVTDGQPRLTPGVKVEVRGGGKDEGRSGKGEGRGGKGEGRGAKESQ